MFLHPLKRILCQVTSRETYTNPVSNRTDETVNEGGEIQNEDYLLSKAYEDDIAL